METITLRVAAKSAPSTVAGAIAKYVRDGRRVEVVAMGPNSVNNTVKAMAIARGFLMREARDIFFQVEFITVELQEDRKSALKFQIIVQPKT